MARKKKGSKKGAAIMKRYFLEVMYDGTAFHGSQLQGELPTVQLALNKALSLVFAAETGTFGSSRTDEGVHALANFYHFDTEKELHPHLKYKLNSLLPHQLAVKKIYEARDIDLNARFDALSRRYRYRIYHKKNPFLKNRAYYYPFKIDIDKLKETAQIIKEYNHFESFSKRNTQSKTFVCNIIQSRWEQHHEELHYVVEANRFLRGMVRGLVGTQLKVGRGNTSIEEFRRIIEANDCKLADFSVAGQGLYLEQVNYPSDALVERSDIN